MKTYIVRQAAQFYVDLSANSWFVDSDPILLDFDRFG